MAPPPSQEMAGNMMRRPHTRYRKLVNRGFTAPHDRRPPPQVRDLAVAIVERALAGTESDFVVDVAADGIKHLPVRLERAPARLAPPA